MSMNLECEPALEPLHISSKKLILVCERGVPVDLGLGGVLLARDRGVPDTLVQRASVSFA